MQGSSVALARHPRPSKRQWVYCEGGSVVASPNPAHQFSGIAYRHRPRLPINRPTKRLSILPQLNSRESHGVEDSFLIRAGFQWWKGLHNFRSVAVDDVQCAGLVSGTSSRFCDETLRDMSRL